MDSTTERVSVLTEKTSVDVMTVSVLLAVITDEVSHCISDKNEMEISL